MADLYIIKRGPRPAYHRAVFHPVIICGKRRTAKAEAGWTGDAAWVWSHERGARVGGWLLERWNGLDIDYGHLVRGLTLPDGTDAAFVHEHTCREPWPLLAGAVWWDDRRMPAWLAEAGVVYPPDRFSQQHILDDIADDGARGFGRERPPHWPEPAPVETWEVTDGPRIPNGATVTFVEGIGCDARDVIGTVVALTAMLERPNGRYEDEYRLRRPDGTETSRWRSILERLNPNAVAAA